MNRPETQKRSTAGNSAAKRSMVIRVVVWGSLAVMAVLTLLDVRSRMAAQRTRDAWIAALDQKVDSNRDLRQSELEPLIAGSPRLPPTKEPADRHQRICRDVLRYTWPGILRSYTVSVYLGLGEDASVEFIEGPGEVVPAAGEADTDGGAGGAIPPQQEPEPAESTNPAEGGAGEQEAPPVVEPSLEEGTSGKQTEE